MEEPHLYKKIVEAIRQDILSGTLKPGERLPTVRQMTRQWECTTGTILRAYQDLARQGLLVSHVGQGTRVAERIPLQEQIPLRRAVLFNRIEAILLEIMTSGYTPDEVEQAMRVSLDRWRAVALESSATLPDALRFVGSHDPAVSLVASLYNHIYAEFNLQLSFSGSLGGLIALAEQRADLAGSHLWDAETDSYNAPFVLRLLPGQRVALLNLAYRQLGLIVAPGNPLGLEKLEDLARPGLRFINRQPGSGTRVWLDVQLQRLKIPAETLHGYQDARLTHSEVAQWIAKKQADVGIGAQSLALSLGLGFVPLTMEKYDLVIPEAHWERPAMQALYQWITTAQVKAAIENLGGYTTGETGQVQWVG